MTTREKILLRCYKSGKLVAIEDITNKTVEEVEETCSFQTSVGRTWAILRVPSNIPFLLRNRIDMYRTSD